MGVKPGTNGNFTFTFDDIATFPQTSMIYLEDLKLGTMTDLRTNNSYQFASSINDDANRFMLHFQPSLQAEVADQDCDNAGSIELTQPAPTVWSTYEVKGNDNNVYATGTNLTGTVTINNLPAQEYVVTVNHPSGYSAQEYITVNGSSPVSAAITASATNVQVDQAVNLTATVTNATEYVWNFGDGSTQTGLTVVSHSYDAAGTYNVTLTASSNVCSDVAVKTIVVSNTTTGIDNAGVNSLNVYGSGNNIVVEFNNWGSDKANLTVYNMLGQQLNSVTGVSTIKGRQEIKMTDIRPGYYLLRVVSGDKTFSRKVFLTADE
jgi:PKD repeat protein